MEDQQEHPPRQLIKCKVFLISRELPQASRVKKAWPRINASPDIEEHGPSLFPAAYFPIPSPLLTSRKSYLLCEFLSPVKMIEVKCGLKKAIKLDLSQGRYPSVPSRFASLV